MINLDTIENGKEQRVFDQIRFEVSKDRMAEWMQELVKGAKWGDVLEGVSRPDAGASEEEKKEFQPKNVRLEIVKVEGAELPEVDDEFAKKVGAENVEKLKKTITDLLNKQADEKVDSSLREQVNEFLIKEYPFDLPESLIKTETDHRLRQMTQDPQKKAQWDKMSQDERKNIEESIRKEATQSVCLFYLSRKVIQDAQTPVTHDEVQKEAVSIYQAHNMQSVPIDQMPKEIYALALSKVILAKAQDYILKKA